MVIKVTKNTKIGRREDTQRCKKKVVYVGSNMTVSSRSGIRKWMEKDSAIFELIPYSQWKKTLTLNIKRYFAFFSILRIVI